MRRGSRHGRRSAPLSLRGIGPPEAGTSGGWVMLDSGRLHLPRLVVAHGILSFDVTIPYERCGVVPADIHRASWHEAPAS